MLGMRQALLSIRECGAQRQKKIVVDLRVFLGRYLVLNAMLLFMGLRDSLNNVDGYEKCNHQVSSNDDDHSY